MFKKIMMFTTCLTALVVSLSIYSCEKGSLNPMEEITQDSQNGDKKLKASLCQDALGSITQSKGMLVFRDMEHFEICADCLDQQYEAFNDAYEANYPDTTPEELDEIDETTGFDEWEPYVVFESSLNHSSLRAKVERDIVAWLDTPADLLNWDDDPDELTPVMDESVRALLNEGGFAIVGRETISEEEWREENERSEKFFDDCSFLRKTKDYFYESDSPALEGRRLKVKIKVKSGIVSSKLKGKTVHYKRKNGKWKRKRAHMRMVLNGPQQNGECNRRGFPWNDFHSSYKKRKSRKVKDKIWGTWREALTEDSSPRWPTERCRTGVFIDKNEGLFFPVFLRK
ncbi:MAG: hypothetical protein AAFZ15_01685 [Bacteroidota bacterium]